MEERTVRANWQLIRRSPVHLLLLVAAIAVVYGLTRLIDDAALAAGAMVGLAFLAGGAIMADAIRREARRTGRA